jgi:hypothetical protein
LAARKKRRFCPRATPWPALAAEVMSMILLATGKKRGLPGALAGVPPVDLRRLQQKLR